MLARIHRPAGRRRPTDHGVLGSLEQPRPHPVGRPDPDTPHVLQIRLLGDPEVRLDGCRIEAPASARLLALLAYLIVHRERAPCRQRIACAFWPDSTESQARTNLRQALHHLRHAVPDPDRCLAPPIAQQVPACVKPG